MEDDQVSNEVAELVESFKENNEVESKIVRKLLCKFYFYLIMHIWNFSSCWQYGINFKFLRSKGALNDNILSRHSG